MYTRLMYDHRFMIRIEMYKRRVLELNASDERGIQAS